MTASASPSSEQSLAKLSLDAWVRSANKKPAALGAGLCVGELAYFCAAIQMASVVAPAGFLVMTGSLLPVISVATVRS